MKLLITAALLFLFASGASTSAQECRLYFPDRVGSVREMKHFDQRDRLSTINRQEIIDRVESGNNLTIKVRSTTYDNNESEVYTGDLEIVCEDGIFRFDLRDYLDPNTLAAYEEMGIEITADNLVYPSSLDSGDVLPDGNLTMVVKSGNTTIITIAMNISNRKLEGIEEVTTEAGTFTCYKISYDISSKAGFISASSSAIEWIAPEVGLVRNETYNRRGRLTGYSVLTDLTR